MKYNQTVTLTIKEKVEFVDGLTVVVTSFSHKDPFVDGPTKATAYITLTKDTISEDIMLSVHGIEGKSPSEDGFTDDERYDTRSWMEYEFQLKKFEYDKSIGVKILKKR